MYFLDIFDTTNTQKILNDSNPDVVVWCIMSGERELEISDEGLRHLLSLLKSSVRFIYISTSVSNKEWQDEDTPPEPRDESMYLANYVNGKILGEQLVQTHNNYVIIRPGQIYGFGALGEPDERMQRIQRAINKDGELIRSANAYISIVHIDDLVSCIVELIDNDFVGILCVASERAISYYSFYAYLAKQIGIDEDKIKPEYESGMPSSYFNTSKANSVLRTKPRIL